MRTSPLLFATLLSSLGPVLAWQVLPHSPGVAEVVPALKVEVKSGSLVAWSAAMPSMWRTLCDRWGVEKLEMKDSQVADELNAWPHPVGDVLPRGASLAIAGVGEEDKKVARNQISSMFGASGREWSDLVAQTPNDGWFAMALFQRNLLFNPVFEDHLDWPMTFRDSRGDEYGVKCFGNDPEKADAYGKIVKVYQWEQGRGIVGLRGTEPGESLILCSMFPGLDRPFVTSMSATVDLVRTAVDKAEKKQAADATSISVFGKGDRLEIPELHFRGRNENGDDLSQAFRLPGRSETQHFSRVVHTVAFDLDSKGAKVEAGAFGMGFGGPPPKQPSHRVFAFDHPFWILVWRDRAPMPYFVAFIDNASAMVPVSGGAWNAYSMSLPPSFRQRCRSAHRLEALRSLGGRPQHEAFVSRGMEYLKEKQNQDGSWGTSGRRITTSLVLLGFAGRCENTDSPFYGDVILKALLWLSEQSNAGNEPAIPLMDGALMAQALGEYYIFARIGSKAVPIKDPWTRLLGEIIQAQQPDGTWRDGDEVPATTAQCLRALLVAKMSGLKIGGLPRALALVRQEAGKSGSSAYRSQDPEMLAAAVAAFVYIPHLARPSPKGGGIAIDTFETWAKRNPLKWTDAESATRWLAVGQVVRSYPELLKNLMTASLAALPETQKQDGSLEVGPSWPEQLKVSADELILRNTALGILTVELPYRYVPAKNETDRFIDSN